MHAALGYLLAVLIGITLGLMGGGGAILTVPTLVYVMNVEPKSAIAMTLPVVGVTAFIGGFRHWRLGNVDLRAAIGFGLLAMLGSLGAARAAKHVPGIVQLTLLGIVMLAAAVAMLRQGAVEGRKVEERNVEERARPMVMAATGLLVGGLTGFVGVGGGFLFVPALALLGGLPMKRAVGTSLIVIGLNTIGGTIGYQGQATIDWALVAAFTGCAVVGSIIGARLTAWVSAAGLRRWFGWLLVVMAAFILWENRVVLMNPGSAIKAASVQVR